MVAAAEKSYGRLNVLFNNAGIFPAADGGSSRPTRRRGTS